MFGHVQLGCLDSDDRSVVWLIYFGQIGKQGEMYIQCLKKMTFNQKSIAETYAHHKVDEGESANSHYSGRLV